MNKDDVIDRREQVIMFKTIIADMEAATAELNASRQYETAKSMRIKAQRLRSQFEALDRDERAKSAQEQSLEMSRAKDKILHKVEQEHAKRAREVDEECEKRRRNLAERQEAEYAELELVRYLRAPLRPQSFPHSSPRPRRQSRECPCLS